MSTLTGNVFYRFGFGIVVWVAVILGNSATTLGQGSIEQITRALDKDVSFDFEEAAFSEVRQWLSDNCDCQTSFILSSSAEDDQLTDDDPVSLTVVNVPLRTALNNLLAKNNATFMIDNGLVRIISRDDAGDPAYFRREVIDCRRLLSLINENELKYPSSSPGQLTPRANNNSGGIFNQEDEKASTAPATDEKKKASDESTQEESLSESVAPANHQGPRVNASQLLVDSIKITITPDDWDDTNGNGSAIMIGGVLVVSGTETQIYQTKMLLKKLESTLSRK